MISVWIPLKCGRSRAGGKQIFNTNFDVAIIDEVSDQLSCNLRLTFVQAAQALEAVSLILRCILSLG